MTERRNARALRLDPGDIIPHSRSSDETLLVYEFLTRVITVIFDRCDDQMLAGLRDERRPAPCDIDGSEDDDDTHFLPDNLTGGQALAIHDFLETLSTAVWDRYEKQMLPLIAPDAFASQDDMVTLRPNDDEHPDFDDDIPF